MVLLRMPRPKLYRAGEFTKAGADGLSGTPKEAVANQDDNDGSPFGSPARALSSLPRAAAAADEVAAATTAAAAVSAKHAEDEARMAAAAGFHNPSSVVRAAAAVAQKCCRGSGPREGGLDFASLVDFSIRKVRSVDHDPLNT